MNVRSFMLHTRALAGILQGEKAFGAPLRVNISLSNQCNIRCIHCFYHSPLLEKKNMFDLKEQAPGVAAAPAIKKNGSDGRPIYADEKRTMALLGELLEMGTTGFIFTGGGEPFLHPRYLEYMSFLKQNGGSSKINTNGTLLNKKVIDKLVSMGMDELRVTTMAGTSEMYAKTHPGSQAAVFDAIQDNLCYLAHQKEKLGVKKPVVNLFFIAVSQNHDGIFDFVEFAKRVQADKVSFRPVDDIHDPGLTRVVPTRQEASEIMAGMPEAKRRLETLGIGDNINFFVRSFDRQINTLQLYRQIPCYYGWIQPRVEVDGNVYPCCRCFGSMGNVNESAFRDIWYGALYRRFRKSARQIHKRRISVENCFCDSCPHYTANIKMFRILHPIKRRLLSKQSFPYDEVDE